MPLANKHSQPSYQSGVGHERGLAKPDDGLHVGEAATARRFGAATRHRRPTGHTRLDLGAKRQPNDVTFTAAGSTGGPVQTYRFRMCIQQTKGYPVYDYVTEEVIDMLVLADASTTGQSSAGSLTRSRITTWPAAWPKPSHRSGSPSRLARIRTRERATSKGAL